MKDIVNLTQHPLARINDSFAFCHHGGWYECDMQTHALCAGALKAADRWATYDYIECNFGNLGKTDADNTRLCAANASLAYKDVWACAIDGGYGTAPSGPKMLLASAQLALNLGVHSAPTVFVNGGSSGHSLTLKQVCDAYTGPKPKGCLASEETLTSTVATVGAHSPCHV